MRRLLLLTLLILAACQPAAPPRRVFYTVEMGEVPTLVLREHPKANLALKTIALRLPPPCGLWSVSPAPGAPFIAIQAQCGILPRASVLNTQSGEITPLVSDPAIDSHFLAWHPDGKSLYLKVGALTPSPRLVRLEVASRREQVLPLSPFVYDLAVSPDGKTLLYSIHYGLGRGAEVWLSAPTGEAQQLLADASAIFATARFSPGGQPLALIRFADSMESFPAGQVMLLTPGQEPVLLTAPADAGRGVAPQWNADGRFLAFVGRNNPGDESDTNLSIFDAETSQTQVVAAQARGELAWWDDTLYFLCGEGATMNICYYEISTRIGGMLGPGLSAGTTWK